ncbi:60s Acidic ribosomal protein [Onchocerca flexuosa]|uniref:Large ribosomal subunit protein P2 n=1 Tax=Onchocerca flexuosa TaxID=387005 RepID=A0A238BXA4_9BILA|nr:60s Acidic ribosomal protein [Onchocerca flexuosa]
MRYVSAYMLATMGTKHHHITTNDIENILGSVGIDCERDKAEEIVKKMQGKTLDELIIEGSKYLSSVSSAAPCGTITTAAAASAGAKDNAITTLPKEDKEEKKEKEEESDEDMGFGLFD